MLNTFIGVSVGVLSVSRFCRNKTFLSFTPHQSPWYTYFSYAVNHSSWQHLGLNMAMMWVVGSQLVEKDNVSVKQMGWLMSGTALGAAGMHQIFSKQPIVGASGIVFGLLGALSVVDPEKTSMLLFPIPGVPVTNMQLTQITLLTHVGMILRKSNTRMALWAHLGGLLSGMFLSAYMWKLPLVDTDAYTRSIDSWVRTVNSSVLVLNWLAISVQLLLGFGDEAILVSKKRFIKRSWREEF